MEQGVFNWKPYLVVVAILLGFGMTVLAMARSMGLV
jgi:F0F1-type ATP synthase assembly protein I